MSFKAPTYKNTSGKIYCVWCDKVPYNSEYEAKKASHKVYSRGSMRWYKETCGWWHLTKEQNDISSRIV